MGPAAGAEAGAGVLTAPMRAVHTCVPALALRTLALLLAAFVSVVGGNVSSAAPYPAQGLVIDWTQADGTTITLRVYGDERYARTETEAGYTVMFVADDQTYYYAVPGPDGETLVASSIAAHRAPPMNLARHLKDSSQAIAAGLRESAESKREK